MFAEIKVYVKQGNQPIGYDYHKKLHGFISKLLGNETYGTPVNNYSFSYLEGQKYKKNGIFLNKGNGYFLIRTKDPKTFYNFFQNYNDLKNTEMFYGLYLNGFEVTKVNNITKTIFKTKVQSPILLNGSHSFLSKNWLDDSDIKKSEQYIMNNLTDKAKALGFELDKDLKIKIKNQKKHSDILYDGVYNKGRVFDLKIECNDETKEFILLNGIGRSCGIGFGMIY